MVGKLRGGEAGNRGRDNININSRISPLAFYKNYVIKYPTWPLLIGCYLAFSAVFPILLTPESIWNIIVQGSTIVLLSLGMTFVMLTGNIDLSVASTAAFAALVGLFCIKDLHLPGYVAILIVCVVSAFIGLLNGLLVTKMRIPSLVATLCTWWMLAGIVLLWTEGRSFTGYDEYWTIIGMGTIGPIRVLLIFIIITIIIAVLISKRTVTGLRMYLVGGNPIAASNMGISLSKTVIAAYLLSAIFAGVAGIVLSSRLGFVSPIFATEWLMPAIAAPVISGVSLTGGRGDLINVVAGAYLVQLIVLVVRVGGLGGFYFQLVQGLLIFIAVIVDTVRKKVMKA